MSKPLRPPPRLVQTAKPWAGRSDLYRWLRAHHAWFADRLARERPGWADLAREVAAAGLSNARGTAPSAGSLRQIWARVRRDLRDEAEAKAQARAAAPPVPPARRKPGSVPAYILPDPTPPAPAPLPRPAALPAPPPPAAPDGDGGYTPEERARIEAAKAGVRARFRKSDEKFRLG